MSAADGIATASDSEYVSAIWSHLHSFNDSCGSILPETVNSVESKLLRGLNETLSAKVLFARGGDEMSIPA